MSNQGKVSEKDQEIQFKRILKLPPNVLCAECQVQAPSWTSIDFGVFICMNCAGAHRALGPSITRVRSTRLDAWTQENIDIMDNIGNKTANQYWEFKLQPEDKPDSNMGLDQMKKFVHQKYIKKIWTEDGVKDPKTRYMQCLISGLPFKSQPTMASKQIAQTPRQPSNKMKTEQDNTKAFYSDNGQAAQWKLDNKLPYFNTVQNIKPPLAPLLQINEDLLSSGKKGSQTSQDDYTKQFRSTPGNLEAWSNPTPKQMTSPPLLISLSSSPQFSWQETEVQCQQTSNPNIGAQQQWNLGSSSKQQNNTPPTTNQQVNNQSANNLYVNNQQLTNQQVNNQSVNNQQHSNQMSNNPSTNQLWGNMKQESPTKPKQTNQQYLSTNQVSNSNVQQQQQSQQQQQISQQFNQIQQPQQFNNQQLPMNQQQQFNQNQWNQASQFASTSGLSQPQTINQNQYNQQSNNFNPLQHTQFNTWSGGSLPINNQFQNQPQQQQNNNQNSQSSFKNNPFSTGNDLPSNNQTNILNLYQQQPLQNANQKNYDALKNNPFQ